MDIIFILLLNGIFIFLDSIILTYIMLNFREEKVALGLLDPWVKREIREEMASMV